jgi:predicted PurR-regulated permease PerM
MPERPGEVPASRGPVRERLRLSNRSVVAAVAILGATLVALRMFAAATRVLGWVLVATVLAGLLHPVIAALDRRLPRGLAIVTVAVGLVALVALVTYGAVDDLQGELRRLQDAAPEAAAELERSESLGEFATEFQLSARVREFTQELPERLRGGDAAAALRSAATRFVAFLATGVLTLFLLVHGRRILGAGARQIRDERRRALLERVVSGAYRRAWRYVAATIGRAMLAGLAAAAVCRLADVPAASVLGIWVAVWSLVPLLGLVVGAAPIVLLATAGTPAKGAAVAGIFVVFQVFDSALFQRRIEDRSLKIGPVLSLVAGMIGFELYGAGGALVTWVLAVVVVAAADELAPTDQHDLVHEADALLPGDEVDETAVAPAAVGSPPHEDLHPQG